MMFRIFNISALVLLATASTGFAQQPTRAQAQQIRQYCEADIRAVCPGIRPGGGRLQQCINENRDRISEPCRIAIDKLAEEMAKRK